MLSTFTEHRTGSSAVRVPVLRQEGGDVAVVLVSLIATRPGSGCVDLAQADLAGPVDDALGEERVPVAGVIADDVAVLAE